jgi:hypothetical protein
MNENDDARMSVDPNMVNLIEVLDSIPGVDVFSSCGGHADPKPGQSPLGQFTVSLEVTHNRRGWQALAIIARATMAFCGAVSLSAWDGSDPEEDDEPALCWDLSGTANPDTVAEVIQAIL